MNRNKENSSYHYAYKKNESLVKDELLEDVQVLRQSNFKPTKGPLN